MADQNGAPPGSKGPYNPLNVFGEQVTVRYAGAGPKPAGTEKNEGEGLEHAIDNLSKHIDALGETISKNLSTAGSLTGGMGGGGGNQGVNHGTTTDRTSTDAYYNAMVLRNFVDTLTKTHENYEEQLDELEDQQEQTLNRIFNTTSILIEAFSNKLTRINSTLGEFRTKLTAFMGDFFSGHYAFDYFSEAMKATSEAASRGIGSIDQFFKNIISFGPDYAHTLEAIKQNLEDGGMAFARSGLSVIEFGKALRDNRNALNRETNADAYLDAKEQDQLMLDSFETLYKQGLVKSITDKKVVDFAAKQLESLKEISKTTGLSLKELIKMQQQKNVSIEEAILAGDYQSEEDKAEIRAKYYALLKANPAMAAEFAKLVAQRGNEALAFGDDPNFGLNMATGRYDALKKIFSGKGSIPELLWEAGQEYEKRLREFGPDIYRLPGLGGSSADFLQVAAALKGFKPNNETMEKIDTKIEEMLGWFTRVFGIDLGYIKGGLALLSGIFGAIAWLQVAAAIIDTAVNTAGIWATLAKETITGGGILGLLKGTVATLFRVIPVFAGIFGWIMAIHNAMNAWEMTPEDVKVWGNDASAYWRHAIDELLPIIGGVFVTIGLMFVGLAAWPALIVGGIAAGLITLVKWLSPDGTFATAITSFFEWVGKAVSSLLDVKAWSDWWNGNGKEVKKPSAAPPAKPVMPRSPSEVSEETKKSTAFDDFSDPVVTALQELRSVLNVIANNTRAGLRYSTQ